MADERLLNKIAEAMELKEVKEELRDSRGERFVDHCEKIILWGTTQTLNHWIGELWGLCEWVQRTKSKHSNRPPEKQLIEDYFFGWDENENMFVNSLNIFYEDEYHTKRQNTQNDSENFRKFRTFCAEISKLLSQAQLTKTNLAENVERYLLQKESK